MKFNKKYITVGVILAVLLIAGCSLLESKTDSSGNNQFRQGALGRYYDFDDIQVPISLKLNKEKSILFRADTLKAGMLFFSDNIEAESLVNFFIDSMARDNWSLKSTFKYPRIMLFFAKQFKTCVIQITERIFSTDVEICVAPAI